MITEGEVFKIGKLARPHGLKGEIAFAFENDVFDRVDCPYLVCDVNGIFVPFFLEEYRFKGAETALLTFEGIDSEEKATRLSGLDVYFPRSYYETNNSEEDLEYSWDFFIGFKAIDQTIGEFGIIEDVDTNTINTLFLIKDGEKEYIVPAVEEFIINIDADNNTLELNLPEGLLDSE